VVVFVFVIGLLNLGLGFLVAIALTEPPPWNRFTPKWLSFRPSLRIPWPRNIPWLVRIRLPSLSPTTQPANSRRQETPDPAPAVEPPQAAGITLEQLPSRWLAALAAEGILPGTVLEAAAQVLRLDVSPYREQLITTENRLRAALAATDAEAVQQLCSDLKQFNHDWLTKQSEAAQVLKQGAPDHGDYERAAADLEQVLHDQAGLIRDCETTTEALHYRTELETGCKRVFERLFQLLDQAHALRDRLNDLLATVLRDSQLTNIGSNLQHDHATGLANRIGLELALHDWWRDDPARERQLTVAVIDIDRLSRVNQRLGTRVGDRAIAALAQLLGDTFRRDRGTDRMVRLSGQSFLVLLGDTMPHHGLTAIERARQTVEAITWDDSGSEFEFTISAGLTAVRSDDTAATVLRRLSEIVKFAKLAGRNRAAIDEGGGPKLLDPPQFTVKGRVVRLAEVA
jgi:diguanylate cyclase (GGDEF)-like protein